MDAATAGVIATAIVGLAGTAAAFFAPTWSQTKIEQRHEVRAFRRARRLVVRELDQTHRIVGATLELMDHEDVDEIQAEEFSTTAWDEHGPILAASLSEADWETVLQAYRGVYVASRIFASPRKRKDFTDTVRGSARGVRSSIEDGISALEKAKPEFD